MIFGTLPQFIINAFALIVAITVHEFSHAWAADRLGDPGPRRDGRLVLNPLVHLDPIGSIFMLLGGFGWGRPVAVNPFSLRAPSRQSFALVAAAGPFSNLVLALIAAIPVRLGLFSFFDIPSINGITPALSELVTGFVAINLGLMLFNLIPLVPLDGSKILSGFVPIEWADALARLDQYGPMILILLFASGYFLHFNLLGIVIGPVETTLYHLITGL